MVKTLCFDEPIIMGILNITPDSFADGGEYYSLDKAAIQAKLMLEHGAEIIDVGGESTRPGAEIVNTQDEIARVVPVIKAINDLGANISIDTCKPEVMESAVTAGASMINDVCAMQNDGALEAAAALDVNVCLMHMQGNPRIMQIQPSYNDVIDDIKDFFDKRINACVKYGMQLNKIILDPGFGFGKTLAHNIEILNRLSELKIFGLPILAGLSRKSMIGTMLNDREVGSRVTGSVAAAMIAIAKGANIVRVHDVLPTSDALTIYNEVNKFKG